MNTIWIWIVFSDEIKARSFCLLCLRFLHQQRRLAQRCNSDPLRLSTAMGNNSNQRTVQSSNSSPIAVSLNAEIYSSASVQSAWPSSGDRLITVGSNFLLPSSACNPYPRKNSSLALIPIVRKLIRANYAQSIKSTQTQKIYVVWQLPLSTGL